jgi:hypothetical protein
MSPSQEGTGGFLITTSAPTYVPGETLQVTLSNLDGGVAFKGFLLQAVSGTPGEPDVKVIGSFSKLPDGTQIKGGCNGPLGLVTHTSNTPKTSVSFDWTPPDTATGPITFHAVAVVSLKQWYGQATLITTTLLPEPDGGHRIREAPRAVDAGTMASAADAGAGTGSSHACGCEASGAAPLAVLALVRLRRRALYSP